jgi:Uncharacterized membrane protein, putative virulence factor
LKKINKKKQTLTDGFLYSLRKVISGTSLSRFFGLIRDVSTTNLLGASVFHDIYDVCLTIPDLFRRFFAEGAFDRAFIPIYSDYDEAINHDDTIEFLNSLSGILVSIVFIFTILV